MTGTFGISKNEKGDYVVYSERRLPPPDSVTNRITQIPIADVNEAVEAYKRNNQYRVNQILSQYL